MSDKDSKKITVSFNVTLPKWSTNDTERFIQAMQKAMPPISAGGLVMDKGRLMPSYYSHEYIVPEKVLQFNFSTGKWE